MSVSDIVGEIARVTEAFEKPTLRLLDGKWAAFRVAVFRAAFSRDRRSVPADRLHAQVDTYLTELAREGLDAPPVHNGRALCNTWVNDQWLFRDNDADGALVYSLTSAALEALDLVATLSRDRVLVSESRLIDDDGEEIGRGTGTFMRSRMALSGLEGYAAALVPGG